MEKEKTTHDEMKNDFCFKQLMADAKTRIFVYNGRKSKRQHC